MTLTLILAVPMMLALPSGSACVFADPVSDAHLGEIVGTGTPTTRLSRLVGEQASVQSQWVGEDQRAALAIWFSDNNVQDFANRALRDR